ncbi:MAG: endonuclease, partial [Flavobacteriales bacterium]|nr:endonuclease [Flavobacteriales bacterium]
KVNGRRGNYPYGETSSATWTSTNGSKVGSCSFNEYTGVIFEPIDEYKGDLARSYFYMATRYENLIASWESNSTTADDVLDGTSDHVFETWHLNLLLKWHKEDPVSTKEINRNDSIYYLYQHNRNPFIDHPEYAKSIWGEPTIPPEESVLFFEDFQTTTDGEPINLTGWTNLAEQGTVDWMSIDYEGNIYAQAKSFDTGEESVVSWLVTPTLNFSGVQNEIFSFALKGGYNNGATIQAYVLTSYATGENPWDATKTELSFQRPYVPSNDYGSWGNSGDIDLSTYSGQSIHIAFKYSGSDGSVKKTTTWQIDSVKVVAETISTPINEQKKKRFSVYPNPAKTTVYIKGENIDGTTIQVYNSLGILLFTEQANITGTYSIDINSLPKGLYIIRIVDKDGQISVNKLVKQ